MKTYYIELSSQTIIAQLQQLTALTWDGDLIDKSERTSLINSGLAIKMPGGWNLITPKGVEYLETLGFISR